MLDYLALGHLTADRLAGGSEALGGAAVYAAATAASLGLRAGLVARAGLDHPPLPTLPGLGWRIEPAPATTRFSNRYDDEGRRVQILHAVAPPIEPADIPPDWRRTGILHLAPVVNELGPALVDGLAADFVGITPQGWLRRIRPGEPVEALPWAVPDAILARADALVLSEEDLAGDPGRVEWLAERVGILVVTAGAAGARAFAGGHELRQPALPSRVADPTGAGDVFAAALFVRLRETGGALAEALRFAAAAAAIAIEGPGLERLPDRAGIAARLAALEPGDLPGAGRDL